MNISVGYLNLVVIKGKWMAVVLNDVTITLKVYFWDIWVFGNGQ